MLYDVGVFVIAILIRSVMLKRLTLYSLEEVSLLYPFQGVKRGGGLLRIMGHGKYFY